MNNSISLPFALTPHGSVETATTTEKVWQDRVLSAVMTGLGERAMRPAYGTDIVKSPFEPSGQMAGLITQEIEVTFAKNLPLLTLISAYTQVDDVAGTVISTIEYRLPSGQATISTIKTGTIDRTGTVIQEF